LRVHLSLGSNLQAEHCLAAAVARVSALGRVLARSRVYESPPQGGAVGASFLNAALVLETAMHPERLKERLRVIESGLGRVRPAPPSAPRTIDVDVIFAEGHAPHPDALLYPHVATPLAEIDPEFRHPETGETLRAIALRLGSEDLHLRDDVLLDR
jgi:2-amino-4-hydroxy-6-hydroxymethyldihydropteridine diphosphokinase